MNLDFLKVHNTKGEKFRLGANGDGGYVITDTSPYDLFMSCGVGNDVTFEKEFLKKYPVQTSYAFDGTVAGLPEPVEGLQFVKKNISHDNSVDKTDLIEYLEPFKEIFLKMDIEAYEYRWLQILPQHVLAKIKQIVIEFHFPFTDTSFGMSLAQEKMQILFNLSKTHTLIHLHANNCCGISIYDQCVVPNVFECTYVRNDLHTFCGYNTNPLPSPLDYVNVIQNADIKLFSYPFVVPKTVIDVWCIKYAGDKKGIWGFGDMLRGTASMYRACKEMRHTFVLDYTNHPVGQFLENVPHEHTELVLQQKNTLEFSFTNSHTNCISLIRENIKNIDVVCLSTNGYLDAWNYITEECKQFLRKHLVPNQELKALLESKKNGLPYHIIHFRLGDELLLEENVSDSNFHVYAELLKKNLKENTILLSDSQKFKDYVKGLPELSQRVQIHETNIKHLGISNDADGVRDTLFEFFLATQAQSIQTYSNYDWVSGFMMAASKIFDVPIQILK